MTTTVPRYVYDPHPVFRLPPHQTQIWRYMPATRFQSLIESSRLFFTRASRFLDDPFEGSVTAKLEADLLQWERAVGMSAESSAEFRVQRARVREYMGVSCWHKATLETEGMWVRYGKTEECVAIRSTVGRLVASLPQNENPHVSDVHGIGVGEVEYIDFTSDTFPSYNVLYPFVHKRREFRHEQEVRAVAMITDAATAVRATPEFEVTEMGLLLRVDVGTLIEAVYVPPKVSADFERDVRSDLAAFGLGAIPVVKSAMTGTPSY